MLSPLLYLIMPKALTKEIRILILQFNIHKQFRLFFFVFFLFFLEHTSARPVLLEANFSSDIKRACRDVPHFVDEMFELFFLEKVSDNFVKL